MSATVTKRFEFITYPNNDYKVLIYLHYILTQPDVDHWKQAWLTYDTKVKNNNKKRKKEECGQLLTIRLSITRGVGCQRDTHAEQKSSNQTQPQQLNQHGKRKHARVDRPRTTYHTKPAALCTQGATSRPTGLRNLTQASLTPSSTRSLNKGTSPHVCLLMAVFNNLTYFIQEKRKRKKLVG